MKKWGWIFLWLLMVAVAEAAPRIYCNQPEWDFGSISDAVSVTNRFLIENRGNSSLWISDVKSSCGCTTASLPVKQLAAGDQIGVTVVFDPVAREGHQRKVIRLYSNDSKTPIFNLRVSGRVSPAVVVMPSVITFMARTSDNMIDRTLTLTYDRPVRIASVGSSSAWMSVQCASSDSARSHVIRLKMDPSQLTGRFQSELTVRTDHPTVPEKTIPVMGLIK